MRQIGMLYLAVALLSVGCANQTHNKDIKNQNLLKGDRDIASTSYPMFDRGPDLSDEMQAELIDIISDMPYVPGISEKLQVLAPSYKRGQKMRPDFGAMPIRGFAIPNSVSVLVIGQDATHIAEGANRPGIAGFGGRVHDMLRHLGVLEGVIFTNLYVNTISGQYGSRNTPVVINDKEIGYTNVLENRLWLMTHDGAYAKWRNRFISWVIRNNKDTLKMVMLLGQAGKDAGASYVNSIGGHVGPRKRVGDGSQYNLPQFVMVGAGGNNEWAVPVTKDGDDVSEVLRKRPEARANIAQAKSNFEKEMKELKNTINQEKNKKAKQKLEKSLSSLSSKVETYAKVLKSLDKKLNYKKEAAQTAAKILLKENFKAAKELMVFSHSGPKKNGVLHPQQFGGWDLRTMEVNGKKTRSISGLKISCYGSQVGDCANQDSIDAPNVVFVGSPHPTSLSMNSATAADKVTKDLLTPLRKEMENGWEPPKPEAGLKSPFLLNEPYKYGRGIIPTSHGDPGITDLRLLPVSTAKRASRSTIVIGTRGAATFSKEKLKKMEKDVSSNESLLTSNTVLTGRPKIGKLLRKYDRGPSDRIGKLLFKSLDKQEVLWVKSAYDSEAQEIQEKQLKSKRVKGLALKEKMEIAYGKTMEKMFDKYGLEAFNYKSHPAAGFFGHYRGTFEDPKVVILADPIGYDSFITSKAATGNRGQYLNGLMQDFKVGSKYLVLSTVPVGMDGATKEEWAEVLKSTNSYRESLINEVLNDEVILIADGDYAAAELARITKRENIIHIKQTGGDSSDMLEAGSKLKNLLDGKARGYRLDIPRKHLTWIARVWEGTSGDRVITAEDKANKGKAFAIVAPEWARKNKVFFSESTKKELANSWLLLASSGDPMPGEKLSDYVRRREACASETEWNEEKVDTNKKRRCYLSAEKLEFSE